MYTNITRQMLIILMTKIHKLSENHIYLSQITFDKGRCSYRSEWNLEPQLMCALHDDIVLLNIF